MSDFEPVIGLEVHAQLSTATKMFCGCPTDFGAAPNAQTCPVCLGLPGALPRANAQAVALAMRAALALGAELQPHSAWARKNYFYPDLPKGYQITQDAFPIARGGGLSWEGDDPGRVELTRIHMEEDAGKSHHDDLTAGGRAWVDLNRAGTPLIEIVSEPQIRSAAAAADYLRALRQLLRAIGACDGNMEEGSLRCDANVSVRPRGTTRLGTRVELKNLNSFRFVAAAITYEIDRQSAVLAGGGTVRQETRLWDVQAKASRCLRAKEDALDYRYFPEPDLPPVTLDAATIAAARAALPELPAARAQRYVTSLGLSPYDARVLTDDVATAAYFEAALAMHPNAKAVANWVINEVQGALRGESLAEVPLTGAALGELVALVDAGTLSGKMAKDVFAELWTRGGSARALVAERGLAQVNDDAALEKMCAEVLAAEPDSVARYRAGKTNVLGFLVGQVMQRSKGRANPKRVGEILRARLA